MKSPELQASSDQDGTLDNAARGRARQATQEAERRVHVARVQAQQASDPAAGAEPEVEGVAPMDAVIGVEVLGMPGGAPADGGAGSIGSSAGGSSSGATVHASSHGGMDGAGGAFGGLDLLLDGADERADETIIGSGDRAHHLALKSSLVIYPPLPLRPARTSLPPLRPTSRAQCQRRCGKAGFCDPSSELGCGGEYCGNRYEPL